MAYLVCQLVLLLALSRYTLGVNSYKYTQTGCNSAYQYNVCASLRAQTCCNRGTGRGGSLHVTNTPSVLDEIQTYLNNPPQLPSDLCANALNYYYNSMGCETGQYLLGGATWTSCSTMDPNFVGICSPSKRSISEESAEQMAARTARIAKTEASFPRILADDGAEGNITGCKFFSYGQEVDEKTYLRDGALEQEKLDQRTNEYSKVKLSAKVVKRSQKDVGILLKSYSSRLCDETLVETIAVDRTCHSTPGASSVNVFKLPATCHIYAYSDGNCQENKRMIAFDKYDEGDTGMCMHTDPYESMAVVCQTAL